MAVVPSAAENLSNKFFQKHDQARTLRDYRNFIPKIVLEKFCSVNEQSTFVFVDQYQRYVFFFLRAFAPVLLRLQNASRPVFLVWKRRNMVETWPRARGRRPS